MAEKKHKVGSGQAILTLKGLLGPGESIKKEDLATPDNFEKLIEKGKIVVESNYVDNDEAQFKAPVKKEKKKEPVKKEIKKSTPGAQKKES